MKLREFIYRNTIVRRTLLIVLAILVFPLALVWEVFPPTYRTFKTFLIHFVKDYVRTIRENWNPVDLAEEQQASFDRRFRTKSRANAKV
jgi:hypothetical protein